MDIITSVEINIASLSPSLNDLMIGTNINIANARWGYWVRITDQPSGAGIPQYQDRKIANMVDIKNPISLLRYPENSEIKAMYQQGIKIRITILDREGLPKARFGLGVSMTKIVSMLNPSVKYVPNSATSKS